MRIVFAGTPEFAAVALRALLATPHHIVAVYTQPDRPAGRGRHLKASPVKELALAQQLPVEQPTTLKNPEAQQALASYRPDVLIVAAYGLILPGSVLETPPHGCLNIHASLLPRWRGAAPIQRAILAGDQQTGITIMQMNAGLDTGDIILKKPLAIGPRETAGELHDRLASLGATAILEALDQIGQQTLQREPQDNSQATYAKKLEKDEAWIDWSQPALTIDRQIRAFHPWPIAQARLGEDIIRIWQAEPITTTATAAPGTIIHVDKHAITVRCGEAAIHLRRCQLPGGKPLGITELLNGHAVLFAPGKRFT